MIADDISLRDRQGPTDPPSRTRYRPGNISGILAENFQRNVRRSFLLSRIIVFWYVPFMTSPMQHNPADYFARPKLFGDIGKSDKNKMRIKISECVAIVQIVKKKSRYK